MKKEKTRNFPSSTPKKNIAKKSRISATIASSSDQSLSITLRILETRDRNIIRRCENRERKKSGKKCGDLHGRARSRGIRDSRGRNTFTGNTFRE